jgi:hypothetical protein
MTSIDRQELNVRESFVDTVRINSAMMGNEMHFLSYTAIDRYYQEVLGHRARIFISETL